MASSVNGRLSTLLFAFGCRRNKFLLTFLFCFLLITYVCVHQQPDINEFQKLPNPVSAEDNNNPVVQVGPPAEPVTKIILYWNSFFGIKDFTFGFGQQPFVDAQCPQSACFVTDDRSQFNRSDVVIFSIQNLMPNDLPLYRFVHQRFVFYEMESPANTDPLPMLDERTRFGFFNWTMTYRLDSDILHRDSYGVIVPRRRTLASSYPIRRRHPAQDISPAVQTRSSSVARNKKKLAAWFVSNCATPSRREDYIGELSQFIPVDIYGKCGNLTCTEPALCREMARLDYKFYIGFENSLCTDYVTEKLSVGLLYDTVPVVRGGVDYRAFAPPHSFIDVNDFESPKELANYLLLLDRTDSLYERYFDWKRDFTVHLNAKQGWCHLCKLAHDEQLPSKIYHDILQWWVNEPENCNLPSLAIHR